jgi:aspartate/methionine/tyrosine aminotransferase
MGGEFVFMEPNYFQIRGIAENLGVPVKIWNLTYPEWEANLETLDELVTADTRAIFVCNPSNPTGRAFGTEFLQGVAAIARRADAWVLADEVYRGAEHRGDDLTPTIFGVYDKAIAVSGLSKAYGLPGTRVGWVVTEADTALRLWSRKDYTTIAPTAVSDMIATGVLAPENRGAFFARTRKILNTNFALLESWLRDRPEEFRWRAPDAGAIVLVEFPHEIDTVALAETLRVQESCLIQPGEQFGVPHHVRIGIGPRTEQLEDGLARLGRVLDRVAATAATGT